MVHEAFLRPHMRSDMKSFGLFSTTAGTELSTSAPRHRSVSRSVCEEESAVQRPPRHHGLRGRGSSLAFTVIKCGSSMISGNDTREALEHIFGNLCPTDQ